MYAVTISKKYKNNPKPEDIKTCHIVAFNAATAFLSSFDVNLSKSLRYQIELRVKSGSGIVIHCDNEIRASYLAASLRAIDDRHIFQICEHHLADM